MSKRSSARSEKRIKAERRPLAIICGGGSFPLAVAEAVHDRGRPVMLLLLRGFAEEALTRFPHHWIHLGAFGRMVRMIKAAGAREVVMVGSVIRPRLSQLRFDLATLGLLPRLVRLYRGGDNRLLSGIAGAFEEAGVRVRGAHEVVPGFLIPEGAVGGIAPGRQHLGDIRFGLRLVRALGPFDVGQAAVVAGRRVLAIEAAEGTAAMLARIAELRRSGRLKLPPRAGVLVKAPKPGQDRRIDLPAIGPETVAQAKAADLAGIAVEAGGTLAADAAALTRAVDEAGLFLVGVRPMAEKRR